MNLRLERSNLFWIDLENTVDWYREEAGSEVAERFVLAVKETLQLLSQSPHLGRPRFRKWPELEGIRSFRIKPPFHAHLLFYRIYGQSLYAERLIHGARDLPRRLT